MTELRVHLVARASAERRGTRQRDPRRRGGVSVSWRLATSLARRRLVRARSRGRVSSVDVSGLRYRTRGARYVALACCLGSK
jgi:hypothetical protein